MSVPFAMMRMKGWPVALKRGLFLGMLCITTACICSCDLAGPIEISGFEADRFPAWSYDGTMVAYHSRYNSLGEHQRGLYIVDGDGDGKRFIGEFGVVSHWLPGDSLLVVRLGIVGLATLNIETGAVCTLGIVTRGVFFSASVDGRFLYFEGESIEGKWTTGIYRYEFSTGSIVPLLDGHAPAVSPDGSKLAYHFSGIRVLELSTGEVRTIATGLYTLPSWFSSSDKLLFHDNGGRIFYSDLYSPRKSLMLGMGPVDVSPDGQTVLFGGLTPDENDQRHIWASDANGKKLRQFTY